MGKQVREVGQEVQEVGREMGRGNGGGVLDGEGEADNPVINHGGGRGGGCPKLSSAERRSSGESTGGGGREGSSYKIFDDVGFLDQGPPPTPPLLTLFRFLVA